MTDSKSKRPARRSSATLCSFKSKTGVGLLKRRQSEGDVIKEDFQFGEQPPGSLKVAFGELADIDEPSGEFWAIQHEGRFKLVGAQVKHLGREEVESVRQLVRLRPVFDEVQLNSLHKLSNALELFETLMIQASKDQEAKDCEALKKEDEPNQSEGEFEPLFVQVGDRVVDVNASLRHVFDKHQSAEGVIDLVAFRQVLSELDLELDDEEFAEAKMAFSQPSLTFAQFRSWWIS